MFSTRVQVAAAGIGGVFLVVLWKLLEKRKGRATPKRIVLIRHGQSVGNIDASAYASTPDWKVRR
jgi:hypothetical protein